MTFGIPTLKRKKTGDQLRIFISSHFQETQHTYAMQLENNSVWDYAGESVVPPFCCNFHNNPFALCRSRNR